MRLNKVVLLLVLVAGCSTDKGQPRYKYCAELDKYLTQHLAISIKDEDELYLLMIPVGSCTPCVEESLEMAIEQSQNKSLKTVLMADNKKVFVDHKALIDKLNSETTYYEADGRRNDFEMGIFSPTIFQFQDGDLKYFKELSVDNIPAVKTDLKWR